MFSSAELVASTLTPVVHRFFGSSRFTPAEHAELLRIARGFACKDSANATNVSPETIRARRKRIYRKLRVSGSSELMSELLGHSLALLARGDRVEDGVFISAALSAPAEAHGRAQAP